MTEDVDKDVHMQKEAEMGDDHGGDMAEITPSHKGDVPIFELKKWNGVALWSWDIQVDNCAICRNHTMDLCIECQASQDQESISQCTVAWGVCNHAFHLHCISRWLRTRQVCPLDNTQWEYQRYGK